MRKTRYILLSFALIALVLPVTVLAYEVKTNTSVYVGADDVIEGNLYAGSQVITIDGTVQGDVICGAQTLIINGTVQGDVICGAQSILINGEINGNVRVAGDTISLNGNVERNVMAFGASIVLGSGSDIGGELFMAGAFEEIRGRVNGDVHGVASSMQISGEINGDLKMKLDKRVAKDFKGILKDYNPLTISDEAKISGNVYYISGVQGHISDQAEISGEVGHSFPDKKDKTKSLVFFGIFGSIYSLFSALVVGLVLVSIWDKQTITITDRMLKKTGGVIGRGVIAMFIIPIVCLLLLVTLIGIPLAGIIFTLWAIAIYLSKILVGVLAGRKIMEKLWNKKKNSIIWAMIIGVLIIWLITSIPLVGWIVALVAIWWGLGGMWIFIKKE